MQNPDTLIPVNFFFQPLTVIEKLDEPAFVFICESFTVFAEIFDNGIKFCQKIVFVIEEELCPHGGIEPGDSCEVAVAACREAFVFLCCGALDIGVGDDMCKL